MAGEEDDTTKEHDPTPKKLETARKKGDFPKSADLNVSAAYAGLLISLLTLGPWTVEMVGGAMRNLIERSDKIALSVEQGFAASKLSGLGIQISLGIAPLFLVPAVLVIASLIAQRAVVIAPSKIAPKISRISVIANAKNKFGPSGLFEFVKSATKLAVFSTILAIFFVGHFPEILATSALEGRQIGGNLADLSQQFLLVVLVVSLPIGTIDLAWQHAQHTRRNRMSRKEIQDESKESDGDPHLKQERRRRAQQIALNQMLSDVPTADVVIVNPTHYAVALKWERNPGSAPICVAKGVDHIAARIREIANLAAVPIHHDPATARSVFANVEVGAEIRPEDYRAVAAAIRFADEMIEKAKWTNKKN